MRITNGGEIMGKKITFLAIRVKKVENGYYLCIARPFLIFFSRVKQYVAINEKEVLDIIAERLNEMSVS